MRRIAAERHSVNPDWQAYEIEQFFIASNPIVRLDDISSLFLPLEIHLDKRKVQLLM